MSEMYKAEVLADSISPDGVRLTSIAITYPHAVHKDMLRHRVHSRVVESFRARPTELLISALEAGEAFKPDEFAKRVTGMQQGEAIKHQEIANSIWDKHVEHSLATARAMSELDIAKQQVNFVLQDLCPLVEIITATDWTNFLALRTETDDKGRPLPRPEVFKTAVAISEALEYSEPRQFKSSFEWHMPLITDEDMDLVFDDRVSMKTLAKISAGRCARVSYDKHRDPEPYEKSIERAERLISSGHMSPFEQVARPMVRDDIFSDLLTDKIMAPVSLIRRMANGEDPTKVGVTMGELWCGNFRGWVQLRKMIIGEHDYSLLSANNSNV